MGKPGKPEPVTELSTHTNEATYYRDQNVVQPVL